MPRPLGPCPDLDDDFTMSEPTRAELVAEALAVFGEDAARELAGHLGVVFEAAQSEPCA